MRRMPISGVVVSKSEFQSSCRESFPGGENTNLLFISDIMNFLPNFVFNFASIVGGWVMAA